jgi:hypothetical protein
MKTLPDNSTTDWDVQMATACVVCRKPIVDSQWFCRLPQKADGGAAPREAKILLCSPFCTLRYFGDPQPGDTGFEPNHDGYQHTLPVAEGQKSSKTNSVRNSREKQ